MCANFNDHVLQMIFFVGISLCGLEEKTWSNLISYFFASMLGVREFTEI